MTDTVDVLTPDALELLHALQREFGERRLEVLARRAERSKRLGAGELPDFLPETAECTCPEACERDHERD